MVSCGVVIVHGCLTAEVVVVVVVVVFVIFVFIVEVVIVMVATIKKLVIAWFDGADGEREGGEERKIVLAHADALAAEAKEGGLSGWSEVWKVASTQLYSILT